MKKLLSIAAIFCATLSHAQKADVTSQAVTASFEQPDFLKNTKTFSYTIQDDGAYWNYTPTEAFPALASNTDGLKLSGLQQVNENGDLQIIVGFSGNQLKTGQAELILNGSYLIMVLDKNDKLLLTIEDVVEKHVTDNPEKYSMANRDTRNVAKAKIVTEHVENLLKNYEHLFSGSADLKIPFGVFKKTKDDAAERFTVASQPLIDAIIANTNDTANLDKAIAFWKAQLDVDFGKKVKDKIKHRVIYANLTSASLLKKDLEAANNYLELVKDNTGFFDLWTSDYKPVFSRFESAKTLESPENLITVKVTPNSAYLLTIPAGIYTYKEKDPITYSKIEIQNFVPNVLSGIASLDLYVKPEIYIYENDVKTLRHFGDGKNVITTNEGDEIIFKVYKGEYKACIKQEDGTYKIYNSNIVVE
ncbi:hypothetical protein [Lacinutrix sp. Hel_I_90]|uniref:hypothetical protein n=1 Tax=Lacinutrix sp. Hel_I_90 TaxID=1249999 RepID=UPI0005C9C7B0|nr:hypothetical protein [Lacinutrix sp. Hel_I_90]